MGFFDDLGKNIGAVLNPVQAGLGQIGAASPLAGSMPGLGNLMGIQNNFQAPLAPIVNPVTQDQINQAGAQYQNGLQGQQDLSQLLLQQAQGQGVNPAQNMLNQSTAQNVNNQAALMAGQRGASSNPGLIARQAAQQGANIQQQGIGQAATLGAQQQLGAMGQLQNQQALQQQGALANQGQLLGAQGAFNNAQVGNYSGVNQANAGVAAGNSQREGNLIGGLIGGVGAALPFLSQGGEVPEHLSHAANCYYSGGQMANKVPAMVSPGEKYIPPQEAKKVANGEKSLASAGEKIPGKAKVSGDSLKNDTVQKNLDAGGIVIPKSIMESDDPIKAGTKFLIEAMNKHKKENMHESDFKEALKKAAKGRK